MRMNERGATFTQGVGRRHWAQHTAAGTVSFCHACLLRERVDTRRLSSGAAAASACFPPLLRVRPPLLRAPPRPLPRAGASSGSAAAAASLAADGLRLLLRVGPLPLLAAAREERRAAALGAAFSCFSSSILASSSAASS